MSLNRFRLHSCIFLVGLIVQCYAFSQDLLCDSALKVPPVGQTQIIVPQENKLKNADILKFLEVDDSFEQIKDLTVYSGWIFLDVSKNKKVSQLFGQKENVWLYCAVDVEMPPNDLKQKQLQVNCVGFVVLNSSSQAQLYHLPDSLKNRPAMPINRVIALEFLHQTGVRADELYSEPILVGTTIPNAEKKHRGTLELLRSQLVFSADTGAYGRILVEEALKKIKALEESDRKKPLRVLVLGSGGGYEAVALAKTTNAIIDAIDIDENAVQLTQLNAQLHAVDDRVRAWQSDLFNTVQEKYDLILFNAPRAIYFEDYRLSYESSGMSPSRLRQAFDDMTNSAGFYDPDGKLLRRLFAQVSQYFLTKESSLLVMTNANVVEPVSDDLEIKKVSPSIPWVHWNDREGFFAIQEVLLK